MIMDGSPFPPGADTHFLPSADEAALSLSNNAQRGAVSLRAASGTFQPWECIMSSQRKSDRFQQPLVQRCRHFLRRVRRLLLVGISSVQSFLDRLIAGKIGQPRKLALGLECLEARVVPSTTVQFVLKNYEAKETAGVAIIMARLDHPVNQPVSVHYQTSDLTAHAGVDYRAVHGKLTFAPMQVSQSFQCRPSRNVCRKIAGNTLRNSLRQRGPHPREGLSYVSIRSLRSWQRRRPRRCAPGRPGNRRFDPRGRPGAPTGAGSHPGRATAAGCRHWHTGRW